MAAVLDPGRASETAAHPQSHCIAIHTELMSKVTNVIVCNLIL